MGRPFTPNLQEILRLRRSGMTCGAIGARYGISRQAIHQLLRRHAPELLGRRPKEEEDRVA